MAKSLNVIWLLSAHSLEDPFCLMEVCAAVRQGTPVLPVRLTGVGIKALGVPLWPIARTATLPTTKNKNKESPCIPAIDNGVDDAGTVAQETKTLGPSRSDGEYGGGGGGGGGMGKRQQRLRRRAIDAFYAQLSHGMPKAVQEELHRNRFLIRDVVAAVRASFEIGITGAAGAATTQSRDTAGAPTREQEKTVFTLSPPPLFDLAARPAEHDEMLDELVGVGRRKAGITAVGDEEGPGGMSWNWERLPETAEQAGRVRGTEAVPWRKDTEVSELIREENAEADDLASEDSV